MMWHRGVMQGVQAGLISFIRSLIKSERWTGFWQYGPLSVSYIQMSVQ